MSETDDETQQKRRSFLVPVVVFVLVVIVYPLSIGPACWICKKTGILYDVTHPVNVALTNFYKPISLLANTDTFGPFFLWYIQVFVDL